jgi:hypothetical protein
MKVTLIKNTTLQRMKQLSPIGAIILEIRTTIHTNLSIYLIFWLFGINYNIFPKLSWSWNFHILAFFEILNVLLREQTSQAVFHQKTITDPTVFY